MLNISLRTWPTSDPGLPQISQWNCSNFSLFSIKSPIDLRKMFLFFFFSIPLISNNVGSYAHSLYTERFKWAPLFLFLHWNKNDCKLRMTFHFSYNTKIACYALDILSEVKDNLVKCLVWTFVLRLCRGQAFQHVKIDVKSLLWVISWPVTRLSGMAHHNWHGLT